MSIDLGLTVDERIADGYYFSRSVRLMRHLLEKTPSCSSSRSPRRSITDEV